MMMWKILYRCRNKERGEKYNEFFHNNNSDIYSNDTSNADNDSKIIDAIVAKYPEAVIINKTNIRKKEWIVRVFMLWLFLYFLIYFLCPKNNGKF